MIKVVVEPEEDKHDKVTSHFSVVLKWYNDLYMYAYSETSNSVSSDNDNDIMTVVLTFYLECVECSFSSVDCVLETFCKSLLSFRSYTASWVSTESVHNFMQHAALIMCYIRNKMFSTICDTDSRIWLVIFCLFVTALFLSIYARTCISHTKKLHYLLNSGNEEVRHRYVRLLWLRSPGGCLLGIIMLALCISVPWEFMRMYQVQVARRASATIQGMPLECERSRMTYWQAVHTWFSWHLSWAADPCEKYHHALLVDPLWEVTPAMVLSSAFTRCMTTPLEIFCSSVGQCFRLIFREIPSPWQPIVMMILTLLTLVITVMGCRYRISLPFILRIEPCKKTPVIVSSLHATKRTLSKVRQELKPLTYDLNVSSEKEYSADNTFNSTP